jgi:L-2-hydroxyglutarate oxidase LhgO
MKMNGSKNSVFPIKKVDSLVLASNDVEKKELDKLYNQGIANGLNQRNCKF